MIKPLFLKNKYLGKVKVIINLFKVDQFHIYIYTSLYVFLNCTLQVLQKVSLLNNIKQQKRSLERNIDHKSISVREYMVFYLLLPQQIPIYV